VLLEEVKPEPEMVTVVPMGPDTGESEESLRDGVGVVAVPVRVERLRVPKYPDAGEIPTACCQAMTAAWVCTPKKPVTPNARVYPLSLSVFWRQETSAPEEPMVRSRVKEQEEEGVGVGEPVRARLTFAMTELSAPKEERRERIAWI